MVHVHGLIDPPPPHSFNKRPDYMVSPPWELKIKHAKQICLKYQFPELQFFSKLKLQLLLLSSYFYHQDNFDEHIAVKVVPYT
jgi:hypothetical protein